jgi:hypothetical protein
MFTCLKSKYTVLSGKKPTSKAAFNSEPSVTDQYKEESYPEETHINAAQQHNQK